MARSPEGPEAYGYPHRVKTAEAWQGGELLSLESSPGLCLPSCWAEHGTKGCRAFRRWGLAGGSGSPGVCL